MRKNILQRTAVPLLMILAAMILAAGCALKEKSIVATVMPEPDYDRLFPRYVEVCAVSQIRSKFARPGGTPGHAVMYLKGACLDGEASYPRLKLCDPATRNHADRETGTGVSVNKLLQNVNWLAIPGAHLFFHGSIEPGEFLDTEHAVAAILEARDLGVFQGIEIHGAYMPPEDDDKLRLYLAAAETLGTDFALSFGRTTYCARLPVTEEVLGRIIGYLNALNDEYATGEAEYNWSGYSDNCAHVLHNALAAAGAWSFQSVKTTKFRQLFNLAVPANEFANLAIRTTNTGFDDPWRLYNNRVLRNTLLEQDWLPMQPGGIITLLPIHQDNELYETSPTIFVLEMPLLRFKSRKIRAMYHDSRFTDLEINLLWFKERYESILAKRPPDWNIVGEEGSYHDFRRRYYLYIEKQLKDVQKKLTEIK
jgi:hypothetical protein